MTEEQLNKEQLRRDLKGFSYSNELLDKILELLSEQYINGLEQSRFDKRMLEYENQELKKQLQELEKENLILREIVMIKKMAIPYKEINDKSLYDLYDMPSYIDLVEEDRKYKEVIDKLNKYMYSDYLINSKEIKDILKEVE